MKSLTIYAAFIPSIPLQKAAALYTQKTAQAIKIHPGRPEGWLPKIKAGAQADLITCGAEFLLDLAQADGILDGSSRQGLGRRRAALVVPHGNPKEVIGVEDLTA